MKGDGVAGADALCQGDSQCPEGVCRAIIGATTRSPTNNWVLASNTQYADINGNIKTTTAEAIFDQDAVNLFFTAKAWVGLDKDWKLHYTCYDWTVGKDGYNKYKNGNIDFSDRLGSCSRYNNSDAKPYCDDGANNGYSIDGCSKRRLYCAQMPFCHLSPAPGVDWSYCNKSGVSLSETDFSQMKLVQTNFTSANLAQSKFGNASMKNSNLQDANLSYANLTNADLSNAELLNANLIGANLTGANLDGADLVGTDFSGATWIDGKTICNEGYKGVCHFDVISVAKSTSGGTLYDGGSANIDYTITNTQPVEYISAWVNTSNGKYLSATIVDNGCSTPGVFTTPTNCTIKVHVTAANYIDTILWVYVYFYITVKDSAGIEKTYEATPPAKYQVCPKGSYCHL